MSREIKFEYGFKSQNGIVKKVYELSQIPNIASICDVWNELPICYVRQFTGLQDKNGNDIFEGDIVSFETDPKGVVRWNNHVLCYTYYEDYKEDEITNSDFLCDWAQLNKGESRHYIVHGNIYETPKLLKTTENE